MTLKEVLKRLEGLSVRGMDFGVERTRALLDGLGSPDKKLKIIHVAGTNGKGSVAEYLTRILLCADKTVGTFTSPAVYDYFEQYRINGENIDGDLFAEAFGAALSVADCLAADGGAHATRFEVETAGALYAFALAGCGYAVVECGLGGLYDATNAIAGKAVAVITSVSLEHTAILGDSIESICRHKAGIIKNCPAVASALQTDEAAAYMRGKRAIIADKPIKIIKSSQCGQTFLYGGCEFFTQMTGVAQPYNAATAIEAARLLKICDNAIYSGVKAAKLTGRLELLTANGNTYVLDGAHNPASFVPLAELLKSTGGADAVVYGSLSDKDIDGNIAALKPYAGKIFIVMPDSPRAMNAEKIYAVCAKYKIPAEVCKSVSAAMEKARGTVAVCGTFTILKEAKRYIDNA